MSAPAPTPLRPLRRTDIDFAEIGGAERRVREQLGVAFPQVPASDLDAHTAAVLFMTKRFAVLVSLLGGQRFEGNVAVLDDLAFRVATCCGVPEKDAGPDSEVAVAFRAIAACRHPLRVLIDHAEANRAPDYEDDAPK